jgi:hypothetical protein
MATPLSPAPRASDAVRTRVVLLLILISFANYFNRITMPVAG